MQNYKIKVKVEFEHEIEVSAESLEYAKALAEDNTMDYIEKTCGDSRRFDAFWEYDVKINLYVVD